jgi:predicted aconitase with swiveling domain
LLMRRDRSGAAIVGRRCRSIFIVEYLGMILGELPLLQLDRTGVALLGAIALIGIEAVRVEDAERCRPS